MNLKNSPVIVKLELGKIKIEGIVKEDSFGNLILDPVVSGVCIPLEKIQIKYVQTKLK